MSEQNFVYVDTNYLKELEETAKKVDYYKGIMDGIMVCTQTYDDKYWLSLLRAVVDGEMSDAGANQAWLEYINRKTEPQTERPSCETCRYGEPNNPKCDECIVGEDKPSNYEPQTDCQWR